MSSSLKDSHVSKSPNSALKSLTIRTAKDLNVPLHRVNVSDMHELALGLAIFMYIYILFKICIVKCEVQIRVLLRFMQRTLF